MRSRRFRNDLLLTCYIYRFFHVNLFLNYIILSIYDISRVCLQFRLISDLIKTYNYFLNQNLNAKPSYNYNLRSPMSEKQKLHNIHEKKGSPHKNQPIGQNFKINQGSGATPYGKTKKNQGIQPTSQHEKPIIH